MGETVPESGDQQRIYSKRKTAIQKKETEVSLRLTNFVLLTDTEKRNQKIEDDSDAKMEEYLKETDYLPIL